MTGEKSTILRARYLGLTVRQTEVLNEIATGNALPRCRQSTLGLLMERGLIEQIGWKVLGQDRFGAIRIPQYEMPIPEHIAWCEWASQWATDV